VEDVEGFNTSLGLAKALQRVEYTFRTLTYERGIFLAPDGSELLEVAASPENLYEITITPEQISLHAVGSTQRTIPCEVVIPSPRKIFCLPAVLCFRRFGL
jgi:hypothetical protein